MCKEEGAREAPSWQAGVQLAHGCAQTAAAGGALAREVRAGEAVGDRISRPMPGRCAAKSLASGRCLGRGLGRAAPRACRARPETAQRFRCQNAVPVLTRAKKQQESIPVPVCWASNSQELTLSTCECYMSALGLQWQLLPASCDFHCVQRYRVCISLAGRRARGLSFDSSRGTSTTVTRTMIMATVLKTLTEALESRVSTPLLLFYSQVPFGRPEKPKGSSQISAAFPVGRASCMRVCVPSSPATLFL